MSARSIWTLLRETFSAWSRDRASVQAAAIAFYTIFSITPLLVLKVLYLGAIASGTLLYGFSMIYGMTGTLNMADLALRVARLDAEQATLLKSAAMVLLV